MKHHCYFLPETPPVFVLLGRYGDLIQLMPAFSAINDKFMAPATVVVSDEYASVFDGVSYVKPYKLHAHWWMGVPEAKKVAETLAGDTICPAFWWDKTAPEFKNAQFPGGRILQSHGNNFGIDTRADPDYGTSMWRRCGFTRDDMMSFRLVFDRRIPFREQELWHKSIGGDRRPVILYNFTGISSQFPYTPEVLNPIMNRFGKDVRLVDLGQVRGYRIFDLIGLMDRAIGHITIDTATLHLAPASSTPYIAFTVDGWTSSVPKGNCVANIKYSQSYKRVGEVLTILESWIRRADHARSRLEQVHA